MTSDEWYRDNFIDIIKEEVKEWEVEHTGNGWNDWINLTCPVCGMTHEKVYFMYNYCPNCGTKLRGNINDLYT